MSQKVVNEDSRCSSPPSKKRTFSDLTEDSLCESSLPSPSSNAPRVLEPCSPAAPYRPRVHSKSQRKQFHKGQRKLLVAEIEFLTQCFVHKLKMGITSPTCVVYVGAACGIHIPYLTSLFSEWLFILVDPARFDMSNYELRRVFVISDFYTDKLNQTLKKILAINHYDVLFISDIRSTSPRDFHHRELIKLDMEAQQRWCRELEPRMSMVKFRLPYCEPEYPLDISTPYMEGKLHLPIWGPLATTECRLISDRDSQTRSKVYDNKQIESQMFFFNTVTRYAEFEIPDRRLASKYSPYYDHLAEIKVLDQYWKLVRNIDDYDHRVELISQTCSEMNSQVQPVEAREFQRFRLIPLQKRARCF